MASLTIEPVLKMFWDFLYIGNVIENEVLFRLQKVFDKVPQK